MNKPIGVPWLASLLLLSGCNLPPETIKAFNDSIGAKLGLKLESSKTQGPSAPKPTTGPSANPDAPDNRSVNADFIREMFQVVLLRSVRGEEFDQLMNSIDQGGHYEGIYNGIVYGPEFHAKEATNGVAPVPALKAYSEIMAQLKLDQDYDPLNIQKPDDEGGDTAGPSAGLAPPQPTQAERLARIADIERSSVIKNTYYLKRTLSEEVLKTIDLKKEYREKLATWFGRFTVALNRRGVDFGLPLRNKTDEYFHYKWALAADEDRLKWECINRLHRIINQGAGFQNALPPSTNALPSSVPPPAPAAGPAPALTLPQVQPKPQAK